MLFSCCLFGGYMDWTEKYRPASLSDVVGIDKAVGELRAWAREWENGIPKDRAVILYGPAGVGKTSAAHALAADMGWDVIELNASDQRAAGVIDRVAGSAARMGTFLGVGGRRLVILDEADNIHGTADRGGEQAIIRVIRDARQPIILIANEYYEMSHGLRGVCKGIQFRSLQSRSIAAVLRRICREEGVQADPAVLSGIAESAGGDLRGAINDLQAITCGLEELGEADVVVASRDRRESVFNVMKGVFKGRDLRVVESTYDLDMSPEDLIHWIDENLPREYRGRDLAAGFERLSRADMFLGRVRRRQNYGMWRYASFLMTSGVQAARARDYRGYTPYKRPDVWGRLWRTKSARGVRDGVARKVARHCHTSTAYARSDLVPFLKLLCKDREKAVGLAAQLDLNENEIAFLLESKKNTKKVNSIYEAAQALRESEKDREISLFAGFTNTKPTKAHENVEEPEDAEEPEQPLSQKSLFEF